MARARLRVCSTNGDETVSPLIPGRNHRPGNDRTFLIAGDIPVSLRSQLLRRRECYEYTKTEDAESHDFLLTEVFTLRCSRPRRRMS
jgi:hypothetical protein